MNKRWDKACGADVHKRFIDATILTSDGTKKHRRFLTNIEGLLAFRNWLIEEDCPVVAVISLQEDKFIFRADLTNYLRHRDKIIYFITQKTGEKNGAQHLT